MLAQRRSAPGAGAVRRRERDFSRSTPRLEPCQNASVASTSEAPALAVLNAVWRVPLILLATALLSTLSVAFSLVDGSGRMQHGCARAWSRFIFLVGRVRVRVTGLERLEAGRGYVFVANHLSMFDHWAFLALLPLQFRFAAKASLFRIPFLGWHLRRSGNIAVDRAHPRQTLEAFRQVARHLRDGISFVIYPEGMRTWDGQMVDFKRGAFKLPQLARAPIVPVTLIDAHHRLPRGSRVIRPGAMKMIIHEPIEHEAYGGRNLEDVARDVRRIIAGSYPENA